MLILTDMVLFLREVGEKFSFYWQYNTVYFLNFSRIHIDFELNLRNCFLYRSVKSIIQASILPLPRIIVRENNSDRARRNRGLYLIYRSEGKPDMYDLECPNSDRRLELVTLLKEAIHKCPVSGFVHLSLPRVLLCRDRDRERDRLHSSSHPALGRTLAAAGSAGVGQSRQSRAIGLSSAAAAAAAGLQTAAESLSTKITPLVERLSQCDSNIQNSCKTRMQTLAEIYSLLLSSEQVALLQDVLFSYFHTFKPYKSLIISFILHNKLYLTFTFLLQIDKISGTRKALEMDMLLQGAIKEGLLQLNANICNFQILLSFGSGTFVS